MNRRLLVLTCSLIAAGVGCASGPREGKAEKARQLSVAELDSAIDAYADRYAVLVGSAVDQIKADNPDAGQRRLAHRIKLSGLLAMNDIASSDDPYTQTLDLLVMVTLQSRIWIDELGAERAFGDRAPILVQALREARVEAWRLAARVMTDEQLDTVDYLIWDWRRKNPGIEQVEFVKFEGFGGTRGSCVVTALKSGGGFLAPISETNAELRQYRRLAERAFWYSKRAPNIAGIQAEAAANEILAAPEVGQLIESINRTSDAGDRVSRTVAALPQTIERERKAVVEVVDGRTGTLKDLMGQATQLSGSVERVTANLNTLASNIGTIADKHVTPPDPAAPPGRPFDITEYDAAVARVNDVVRGLNELTENTDKLAQSQSWRGGLQELSDAADRRVRFVFTNVYVALGVWFVLAVCYRLVAGRLASRRSG
jgi:hypothetical protein